MTGHIGVIILHWKRLSDTRRCVESVFQQDYAAFHVLLVDNGSSDQLLGDLTRQFPGLELCRNQVNRGYSGGNNVGLTHFLRLGASAILLLNNDAVLEVRALSALAQALEIPKAGCVGPRIIAREDPTVLLSAGGRMEGGWNPVHRGLGERDKGQFDSPAEVDFLSGCALLVRREMVEAIGKLDPDFFAYYEDVDWCLRARAAGYRAVYLPQARVLHPDTRARDVDSPLVTYYMTRNHLLLARKHHFGRRALSKLLLQDLHILASWSVRPRWRYKRAQRAALLQGLRDYFLGKFGRGDGY